MKMLRMLLANHQRGFRKLEAVQSFVDILISIDIMSTAERM